MRPLSNPARPLTELAAMLNLPAPRVRAAISGVTHDSRRVQPGDLYVALPGSRWHGAEFITAAAAAGATAVLTDPAGASRATASGLPVLVVDRPRERLGEIAAWVYGEPAAALTLIGITGTSGKTTTAYLVESGLAAAGHVTGLVGTVATRVAGRCLPSELTTPEATDLHALFALMREQGVTGVAMEVSSHALAYGRVGGAHYDVAVFTNLSQDHLDFHRDMQEYFAVKARLFTPAYCDVAVVNADDLYGQALVDLLERSGRVPVVTFSPSGDRADWRAVDARLGADGSAFRIVGPGGVEADASVQIPGRFNVANALAAVVALVEAGIPLQTAVAGVATCPGVPGRMERIDEGQDFSVIVDYSHKPAAVDAVLTTLRQVGVGRLTVVLGCGGDRDRAKRPLMGEAAARLADLAVFTNDNPRSEDPLAILAAMMEGVVKVPVDQRAHIVVEPDRAAAIDLAIARAAAGDVVVVAGKGHEQGQHVGAEVHDFDDRDVVRRVLRRRLGGQPGREERA